MECLNVRVFRPIADGNNEIRKPRCHLAKNLPEGSQFDRNAWVRFVPDLRFNGYADVVHYEYARDMRISVVRCHRTLFGNTDRNINAIYPLRNALSGVSANDAVSSHVPRIAKNTGDTQSQISCCLGTASD